ncbi:Maf/Ham1 [Mycena sanguinolenta]|nr:Maf/Ham1 [Mycena sanguinolenta]
MAKPISNLSGWKKSSNLAVFVTGNANKLTEVNAILSSGGNPIEIESRSLDSKLAPSFWQPHTHEVAIAKCRRAAELLGRPCITEDTALCFEASKGLPGPYIKYFLADLGHEGLGI